MAFVHKLESESRRVEKMGIVRGYGDRLTKPENNPKSNKLTSSSRFTSADST